MANDIVQQLNWVDLLFVILIIRIGYVSLRNGFLVEIFKLLATVIGLYVACHYYSGIAGFFQERFYPSENVSALPEMLSFLFLYLCSYNIIILPRHFIMRFLKIEPVPLLVRWGGLLLGLYRGILFCGILFFLFYISVFGYLSVSVSRSYSGRLLVANLSRTYSGIWNGVMSKFTRGEEANARIDRIAVKLTQ